MDGVFDIQRDHQALIKMTASLLTDGGVLMFSTNCRNFKLDKAISNDLIVNDISAKTLPKDFERNVKIHYCWKISNIS